MCLDGAENSGSDGIKKGMKDMDENDKKKAAVAVGAALFLVVAAFGFTVAAMQGGAADAANAADATDADDTGDEMPDADSRIRDADMAREMIDGDRELEQAAEAMLAQANQQPQGVLQLLR